MEYALLQEHSGPARPGQRISGRRRQEREYATARRCNCPFLFDFIDRQGFDSWIGCEYKSAAAPRDTLEWLKPYLRRAAR
jgi:hypothetical protein